MKKNSTDFAELVTSFLTDYLPFQRNFSRNTILSYRDALKLFLRFVTEEKSISLKKFRMKDFTRELVIEFLEWYRSIGASSSAANQRLAALKTFAEYAQLECIEFISPLMSIGSIKSKKTSVREISYLSSEQMALLINRPDVNTVTGFRHRVILTLLYDTGCRVQELCDMSLGDIFISANSTVRLHGKGSKFRTVVISDETAKLISSYISRYKENSTASDYLITNRNGQKISRDGIGYIITKYVNEIRLEDDTFPEKVHCHMFRHSKAMHMLAADINIIYIRDFLGHADISTTMIYAKADNRIRNEVIGKLSVKIADASNLPDWNKDKDLMEFLSSIE